MTYSNPDIPEPPGGANNKEARKDKLFTVALASFVLLAIIIFSNVLGWAQDDSPDPASAPSPTVSASPSSSPTETEDHEPTEEPTEESETPTQPPLTDTDQRDSQRVTLTHTG